MTKAGMMFGHLWINCVVSYSVSKAGKPKRDVTEEISTTVFSLLQTLSQYTSSNGLSARQIREHLIDAARKFVDGFRSRVERSLYSPYRAFAVQYLLRRLSLQATPPGVDFSFDTVQVEHVYPQRPREATGWIAGDATSTTDPRYKLRHHIGNLFLLRKLDNVEASNKSWKDKREIYARNKLGEISLFPITVEVVNDYSADTDWTEGIILEGTADLLERLHKIYPAYFPSFRPHDVSFSLCNEH